jgi:hypothetical protein
MRPRRKRTISLARFPCGHRCWAAAAPFSPRSACAVRSRRLLSQRLLSQRLPLPNPLPRPQRRPSLCMHSRSRSRTPSHPRGLPLRFGPLCRRSRQFSPVLRFLLRSNLQRHRADLCLRPPDRFLQPRRVLAKFCPVHASRYLPVPATLARLRLPAQSYNQQGNHPGSQLRTPVPVPAYR